jgi:hypothetical protein
MIRYRGPSRVRSLDGVIDIIRYRKQELCRVQPIGHSAKSPFAECCQRGTRRKTNTRQMSPLPSVVAWTLGKERIFVECHHKTLGKKKKNSAKS